MGGDRGRWRAGLAAALNVVAAIASTFGCTCGSDETRAPAPPPVAIQPAPPPAPGPAPADAGPQGLQPAPDPILSAAVPEGFAREETPPGTSGPNEPWVHVRGTARLLDVIDFYTRYLDPGTPSPTPDLPGRAELRCKSWSVGTRPDCPSTSEGCVERTCVDFEGGLVVFANQRPKPPGEPGAVVNVLITTVGGQVRVTIENESLMRIVRENAGRDETPLVQDLTKYKSMDELPSEFID